MVYKEADNLKYTKESTAGIDMGKDAKDMNKFDLNTWLTSPSYSDGKNDAVNDFFQSLLPAWASWAMGDIDGLIKSKNVHIISDSIQDIALSLAKQENEHFEITGHINFSLPESESNNENMVMTFIVRCLDCEKEKVLPI